MLKGQPMSEEAAPHITCLMECSVDGRLDESRWSKMYDPKGEGSPDVYYETLSRLQPEAVMLGRVTVRENFCAAQFRSTSFTRPQVLVPFRGIRDRECMAVIFDSRCRIAYECNSIWDYPVLAVLGGAFASKEYLRYLREREISYTFAGEDGRDLHRALASMSRDFGLRKLVLAGGGSLNGSFLKAGLIDELYVVIYPGLDGLAGMKCIFEYPGEKDELPASGQTLELLDAQKCRAGVVLLSYRLHKEPPQALRLPRV